MRFTSKNLLLGLVAIVLASCASTPDTHSSKGQVATEPTVTRPAAASFRRLCSSVIPNPVEPKVRYWVA